MVAENTRPSGIVHGHHGAVYDAGSSSMLTSCYNEAESESEINDSRFNDISCISYADRTIDEKDSASRNDVSNKSLLSGDSNSQRTANGNNTSQSAASDAAGTKDNSGYSSSGKSGYSNTGSKRTFKRAFKDNNSSAKSTNSAKRLKRDSSRQATDGMQKTNPVPLAIPIP